MHRESLDVDILMVQSWALRANGHIGGSNTACLNLGGLEAALFMINAKNVIIFKKKRSLVVPSEFKCQETEDASICDELEVTPCLSLLLLTALTASSLYGFLSETPATSDKTLVFNVVGVKASSANVRAASGFSSNSARKVPEIRVFFLEFETLPACYLNVNRDFSSCIITHPPSSSSLPLSSWKIFSGTKQWLRTAQ